ncbi:MAG: ABC-ATPase domain-containing protein [Pyrodictiaceae archaeon]
MRIARILEAIDGRGYKNYKKLLGLREEYRDVLLEFVKIQSDPYAPPSIAKLSMRLPEQLSPWARLWKPLSDIIARRLYKLLQRASKKVGEGYSGYLGIPRPSPIVIARSSVVVRSSRIEARVRIGLPSKRRRILASEAIELIYERLIPAFIKAVHVELSDVKRAISLWRDQEHIRAILPKLRLVAFVGDGSILPRKCSGCYEPLDDAIPFESPSSLRVELELPSGRMITGMGIPRGIFMVMGSAFHGKTTLLEAIAEGVWNHIEGDGREFVITVRDAVIVRSEQGRRVSCVDISPFIHDLPSGQSTHNFTTNDASGATSAAAAIQEAIELGSSLLLLDEDNVSSNILYKDPIASKMIRWHTVTPLTELARQIVAKGVSLILVSQGTSQLIGIADNIIVMEAYRPIFLGSFKDNVVSHGSRELGYERPKPRRLNVVRLVKPRIRGMHLYARNLEAPIDLSANIQLVEEAQFKSLEKLVAIIHKYNGRLLREVALDIEENLAKGFFEKVFGETIGPELGEVRAQDVAFLINRIPWRC